MKTSITTSIIVLVTLLQTAAAWNQAEWPEVRVSFESATEISLGEPLTLLLTIQNRSRDFVDADLGWDRRDGLQIRVTKPNGSTIDVPRLLQDGISSGPIVRIPAGRTYSQQYIVDERMPLREPGVYRLRVWLSGSFKTADGRAFNPPTDTVFVVNVTPRSAAGLQRKCESLAIEALSGTDYSVRDDAARALSYMADAMAVPCIQRVIRGTNRYDSVLVRALGRIGTESARAVLEEMFRAAKPSDHDRFDLANDALRRFKVREP